MAASAEGRKENARTRTRVGSRGTIGRNDLEMCPYLLDFIFVEGWITGRPLVDVSPRPCELDRDDLCAFAAVMSHQVNLSSREIATAYQAIVGGSDIDWVLLTYDKGSNDLKVCCRVCWYVIKSRLINVCVRYKIRAPVVWKSSKRSFQMAGSYRTSNFTCPSLNLLIQNTIRVCPR